MNQNRKAAVLFTIMDVALTIVSGAFNYFWTWWYYADFRPPDLNGIARSSSQLINDIVYISFLNVVSSGIFAVFYFLTARILSQQFGFFEGGRSRNKIIRLTIIHWVVIFLPTLWLAYNFWILHTGFTPPIMPPTE